VNMAEIAAKEVQSERNAVRFGRFYEADLAAFVGDDGEPIDAEWERESSRMATGQGADSGNAKATQ